MKSWTLMFSCLWNLARHHWRILWSKTFKKCATLLWLRAKNSLWHHSHLRPTVLSCKRSFWEGERDSIWIVGTRVYITYPDHTQCYFVQIQSSRGGTWDVWKEWTLISLDTSMHNSPCLFTDHYHCAACPSAQRPNQPFPVGRLAQRLAQANVMSHMDLHYSHTRSIYEAVISLSLAQQNKLYCQRSKNGACIYI